MLLGNHILGHDRKQLYWLLRSKMRTSYLIQTALEASRDPRTVQRSPRSTAQTDSHCGDIAITLIDRIVVYSDDSALPTRDLPILPAPANAFDAGDVGPCGCRRHGEALGQRRRRYPVEVAF